MNKVTKKELVEKANEHELRIFQIEKALEQHGINWFVEEPKLKQLDQSSFKGMADCWKFIAVDKDGQAWRYREEPKIDDGDTHWSSSNTVPTRMGSGYDASNWQNSLIERDKVDLTGSDLARAMLERGDKYVMCANQSAYDDWPRAIALNERGRMYYISGEYSYDANDSIYPINNQGEPLTQSDVGL